MSQDYESTFGVLASHPIQYQAPLFRSLAKSINLQVYFSHKQTSQQQAQAGFGVAFDWDTDLLAGYQSRFLSNVASEPGVDRFFASDCPEIESIIRDESFDVFLVTGWHLKSYWQAIRACHKFRVPVLVRGDSQLATPRSWPKRLLKVILYRWLIRQFDGYLIVGQRATEYLLHYGAPPSRMFNVPHFVDNEFFAKKADAGRSARPSFRAELGIPTSALALLFVGKFIPKKRPVDLLLALDHLKRRGLEAYGLFVGSGPLEGELRTLSTKLGVSVYFAGFKNQSELPPYYVASDIIVLPSDGGETWGLVINEAMACGTPAIVSDAVGCGPDLVLEGKTGATYPCGQPEALANAVLRLIPLLGSIILQKHLAETISRYSLDHAVTGICEALQFFQNSRLKPNNY